MDVKVAKAEKEEFDRVFSFINVMDTLFDDRPFFDREEEWRDWPDDDPDKKLLLECEKKVKEEDGESIWGPDNRLILYEFIKRKWRSANWGGSFGRIVFDAQVMIKNTCDPDLDYLEYNKDIKEALKAYNPPEESK